MNRLLLTTTLGGLLLASAVFLSAQQSPSKAVMKSADGDILLAPHITARTCMLQITPPKAVDVLTSKHETVDACANEYGADWTIKTISCYANNGSPTVTVNLTGSKASLTEKAIPCGERTWLSGLVKGTPVVHSFSELGSTCAVAPCSLEARIDSTKGASNWVILRITGQL